MIPQELSALMALRQGMQQGRVSTTTPAGEPTVAAQDVGAAEQAMAPAVPQAVQQAGLAAQIQAMRMQEAQKAMMNAAMQQQQQPVMAADGGLMRLNPNIKHFDEGGIVGYADGDVAVDPGAQEPWYKRYLKRPAGEEEPLKKRAIESLIERLATAAPAGSKISQLAQMTDVGQQAAIDDRERQLRAMGANAPMMDIPEIKIAEPERPPAPPRAQQPTGVASLPVRPSVQSLAEQGRALIDQMKTEGASPEQIAAQQARNRQAEEANLISQGLDPRYLEKRGAEDKALIDQQRALLRERMEREQGRDTFLGRMGEALRGFRQMKGQGIGTGILSAEDALSRRVAGTEARMDQMRDMELKINELEMVRRRALEDARHSIARGDWNKAKQELETAQAADNEKKKMKAQTFTQQATATVQEAQVASSEAARADARRMAADQKTADQLRMNLTEYDKEVRDIEKRYADMMPVKSYLALSQTGKVSPEIETAYRNLMVKKDQEIAAKTADRRKEIERLQGIIYGPGAIKPAAISTAEAPRQIAPGTIMQGYRFKGGDPGNRSNWEKV